MSEYNGYIPAGFDTYVGHTKNRIEEKYWSCINEHLINSTSGAMSCYGDKVINNKNSGKSIASYAKNLLDMKNSPISKGIDHYIDSGGYQVITGKLDIPGINFLNDTYYKFLKENKELYSKSFILDLPINNNCFNSYEDIYFYNQRSYKQAAELPDEVRSKILYVSHFTTPENAQVFDRIFNEVDAINTFSQFAVGGVAGRTSSSKHFISYFTIPIVYYLKYALDNNVDKLHIHFLGADSPASIIFYKFAEIIAKERHGIELRITYDSAVFHRLILGKGFRCIEDGKVTEISYLSRKADKNYGSNKSNIERIKDILNKFARNIGLHEYTDSDHIYEGDDLNPEMEARMLIYHPEYMFQMSKIIYDGVLESYPYKSIDIYKFNELTFNIVKNASKGVFKRNQKILHNNLPYVIDILENLDYNKTRRTLKQHADTTSIFSKKTLTI